MTALVAALTACGGGVAPEPRTPIESAPAHAGSEGAVRETRDDSGPNEGGDSLRELGADATFADLVARVDELESANVHRESDAGCLLRRRDDGFRLSADLAAAIRPLPKAPKDVKARVEAVRGTVTVLSVWGRAGEASELALSTFATHAPTSRGMPVLFLTAAGVFLRATDRATSAEHAGPFPIERTTEHLSAVVADTHAPVVVTADASTPVSRLLSLLRVLEGHAPGATLAVVLEPNTKLPPVEGPVADGGEDVSCPGGELPGASGGTAPGEADEEELRRGFARLAESARACASTMPTEGSDEARFTLKIRIGREGTPLEACATQDSGASAALRACVVHAAKQLRFAPEAITGYVEVELPLSLTMSTSELRQRSVCD